MSAKLTPWFESHVKPYRYGVYEIALGAIYNCDDSSYSFWNGRMWGTIRDTPQEARNKYQTSNVRHDQLMWRGRASRP